MIKAVDWSTLLGWSVLAWNHSENAQGLVPAEQFLGRRQINPWACFTDLGFSLPNFSEGVAQVLQAQEIIANAMSKAAEYQNELKEKEAGAAQGASDFPPGTRVYVKAPLLNEHYKKLRERWRGVYVVVHEYPTACMVMPLRQQIKVDLNQLPRDVPKGVSPSPNTMRKIDKSELKKCRTLTFFSRPLANEYHKLFLAPYVEDDQAVIEPDVFGGASDLHSNGDSFLY